MSVCGLSLGQVARASHLSRVDPWLEFRLLAAGLVTLRQPGHPDDGGQILEFKLLAAGLGYP